MAHIPTEQEDVDAYPGIIEGTARALTSFGDMLTLSDEDFHKFFSSLGDDNKLLALAGMRGRYERRQAAAQQAATAEQDMESIFKRVLKEHEEQKENTIVISNVSKTVIHHLERRLKVIADRRLEISESVEGVTFKAFEWGPQHETERTFQAAEHLISELRKMGVSVFSETEPKEMKIGGYELLDVSNNHTLLNFESDMFKISGGTDAVIVPSGMRENKEQQLCCVIEFKRTIPGNQEECPPQLVAEALSAQMVSYQNVLSIYTDFCSTHAFGVQFRMDDDGIVKFPIIYTSLDAMAHHIAQFLEKFCQPIPVRVTNNRSGHDNADASGGDKTDHDNDEEGDEDNAGSGPDFKKPRLLVNTLMKRANGDISLAHEHFNDHFGDTEPLTEERVIMVKHLFQSYGFALPIWDKIRTI